MIYLSQESSSFSNEISKLQLLKTKKNWKFRMCKDAFHGLHRILDIVI